MEIIARRGEMFAGRSTLDLVGNLANDFWDTL